MESHKTQLPVHLHPKSKYWGLGWSEIDTSVTSKCFELSCSVKESLFHSKWVLWISNILPLIKLSNYVFFFSSIYKQFPIKFMSRFLREKHKIFISNFFCKMWKNFKIKFMCDIYLLSSAFQIFFYLAFHILISSQALQSTTILNTKIDFQG